MPRVIFLDSYSPLADQVAAALLDGVEGVPADLGGTEVWIPTAGAGRRIRRALARRTSTSDGVLSPRFVQPMSAMIEGLEETAAIASRAEREAAWALVLKNADPDALDSIFPRGESLAGERQLLGAGGLLADLCDRLAEGALDPDSPAVAKACEADASRWEQLAGLYRSYQDVLQSSGLSDPNVARLQAVRNPELPDGLERVVVACIPDLSRAAEYYANSLETRGVRVVVLVWKPCQLPAGFDGWGRPVTADWQAARLDFPLAGIIRARNPEDESGRVLDYLAAAEPPGDYELVLADPELAPVFQSEILQRGSSPFIPDGMPLSRSEAGIVALRWVDWQERHDLRTLRQLLESPKFLSWMKSRSGLSGRELFSSCDSLLAESLVQTLSQAEKCFEDCEVEDASKFRGLLSVWRSTLDMPLDRLLWEALGESAAEVLDLWHAMESSAVLKFWPEGRVAAFERALSASPVFEASNPGDIELSGWLEAPWSEAGRLVVSGFVEGVVPASTRDSAFLPDSARKRLGIPDTADRRARDAYLLACLASVRDAGGFRVSFSKFGIDESPALPSNLLLSCSDDGLPSRIQSLFEPASGDLSRPLRRHGWKWSLTPEFRKSGVTKVSPTDFSAYLTCPLRFYFGRVLRMEPFDPRAREMDALRFGTLIHAALEQFAREAPDESDEHAIAECVLARLDDQIRAQFGSDPSPAVRVQIEAARVRLLAFARVQAAERLKGWKILDVECKLSADETDPLMIGPLPLSAKIDRIEEHPEFGLRILDYKTYATAKPPSKTHYGPVREDFPETAVTVDGKARSWVDLQLPLYSVIAGKWYPGRPVSAAYFLLPSDPAASCIENMELPDDIRDSAIGCAVAVAERIRDGIFWPPREHKGSWDDPLEPLLPDGGEFFDGDTITFLKGCRP